MAYRFVDLPGNRVGIVNMETGHRVGKEDGFPNMSEARQHLNWLVDVGRKEKGPSRYVDKGKYA